MSFVGNLIGSFVLGAAGWLVAHLIANPLLIVWRVREEAPAVIFKTTNVGPSAPADEWGEARDQLRDLAARIKAAHVAALPFVRRGLLRYGVDLQKAVEGLVGLSDSLDTTDGSRALHRAAVERALRLPLTDTEAYLKGIEDTLSRR